MSDLQVAVDFTMERLRGIFGAEYRITIVARNVAVPDASSVFTDDDLDECVDEIKRLMGEGS